MKRYAKLLGVGLLFGVIDLIPLIPANAPLFNMLAIVSFWVVATLVLAHMQLLQNTVLDGILFTTLLMLPLILTVTAVNPKDFIPMLSMAVILGPACTTLLHRLGLRELSPTQGIRDPA